MPAGQRVAGYNRHKDLMPTILELAGIETGHRLRRREPDADGARRGDLASSREFYITECTWMRKHGWRTPEWKLIVALEPDFHFKPPVELYNLIEDPGELINLAESEPEMVALLRARMDAWIARREPKPACPIRSTTRATGTVTRAWAPFTTSQQAYDTLHIGDPTQAAQLQAEAQK